MRHENCEKRSWRQTLLSWSHPRAIAMLFLGFAAGIPILLIFSTLSVWLREAGVSRSAVTFFSWAALGYSFKFIWAPLVDLLPLPLLTRVLGRRRGWLLVSQLMIIIAICWMGLTDPLASPASLTSMALAAVLLGFSSATQDIVIDAYRIESAEQSLQAMLASMYIAGYRIGMLVAGAGSLYVASWFGTSRDMYVYSSWQHTYLVMAAVMMIGVATTLVITEPQSEKGRSHHYSASQYMRIVALFLVMACSFALIFFFGGQLAEPWKSSITEQMPQAAVILKFLIECCRFFLAVGGSALVALVLVNVDFADRDMVKQSYLMPIVDFFTRYKGRGAVLLLLLIGFYRISDIVLGVVANVFYVDLGFTNAEIASISKTFGLFMTLAGGFVGGFLTVRYGVMRILFVGALLSAATNLLFMLLSQIGHSVPMLTVVIAADNLSGGLATTAFVAFLSSLTSISFTAVQYAIFSSVMTLFPKLFGGFSGSMVSAIGYETFFLFTACIGIPILFLIWMVRKEKGVRIQ